MPLSPDAAKELSHGSQPLPNVVTGGQPTEDQLARLRDAGVKVVVDLRDPMEPRAFDEPATARALGLEYVNIPVRPGATSDDQLERVREVLRNADEKPVLLHCASANRVGGALIPHLMLDHGATEDEATERAMHVGLRSAEYLQWGLGYAQRKGARG